MEAWRARRIAARNVANRHRSGLGGPAVSYLGDLLIQRAGGKPAKGPRLSQGERAFVVTRAAAISDDELDLAFREAAGYPLPPKAPVVPINAARTARARRPAPGPPAVA